MESGSLMTMNNHALLADILDNMSQTELNPDRKHHYQIVKMTVMESLELEKAPTIDAPMGAMLLMAFALEWWIEVGFLNRGEANG